MYSLSQLGEVRGNRASGIGHYQLPITNYQFSVVPHLSEKSYSMAKKKKINYSGVLYLYQSYDRFSSFVEGFTGRLEIV
ncbi:hypothetical protein [Tychonema sp. BBK16]|uniref:hypothetical protein n=1 Tax=Tychonema sp. BBK16 TaxID=2699888 RepID=UPI001F2119AB|nr:hypothetical protein [Tychonema sp. BBK16]MCF6373880.1 hypothetical protein [Tychonema sp. BBK16]